MLFVVYYFWVAPHILLSVVLFGILRRKLQYRLPVFFSYVLFSLSEFLVLFTIDALPRFSKIEYQWVFVCALGISMFLKLGIVYELSNELLISHSTLGTTLRPLLRWTAALLLLAAAVISAVQFRSGVEKVENIFRVLDLSWSVMLSGLVISLFLFARAFHISWRSSTTGVAAGFGVFAAIELATAALRAEFAIRENVISVMQMAAYHVCVLVWVIYVFLPEQAPKFEGAGLGRDELELWDQELQRMARR